MHTIKQHNDRKKQWSKQHSSLKSWISAGIGNKDDAHIYCAEELDVPQERIEEVDCFDNAFKLPLRRCRSYFRDDWYVNMQRIDSQSA